MDCALFESGYFRMPSAAVVDFGAPWRMLTGLLFSEMLKRALVCLCLTSFPKCFPGFASRFLKWGPASGLDACRCPNLAR